MVIRELLTKWGFKVDSGPLKKLDGVIGSTKRKLASMGRATARTAGRVRSLINRNIALAASMRNVSSISTLMNDSVSNMRSTFRSLSIALIAATAFVGLFLNRAGKMEQAEIAFETMLGSAERAKKMLGEITHFAKTTPFTLTGLVDNSKRLLAMGIEAENLMETVKVLGDITAGVGTDRLPLLVLALGQVKAATKLRGQEIRQFTESGVPIIGALAEQLKTTEANVFEMTSKGQISFDQVFTALKAMTEEGGKFNNLMIRQSKSLLGIVSNIIDSLEILSIKIGKTVLPEAKRMGNETLKFLEKNEKEIMKVGKSIIGTMINFAVELFEIFQQVFKVFRGISQSMGGLGPTVRALTIAFLAFIGLRLTSSLGGIANAALLGATHFKTLTKAITGASGAVGIFSLITGGIIVALALIAEDIVAFSQGRRSLFGLLVHKFEELSEDGKRNLFSLLTPIRMLVIGFRALAVAMDAVRGKIEFSDAIDQIGTLADELVTGGERGDLLSAMGFPQTIRPGAGHTIDQNRFQGPNPEPGFRPGRKKKPGFQLPAGSMQKIESLFPFPGGGLPFPGGGLPSPFQSMSPADAPIRRLPSGITKQTFQIDAPINVNVPIGTDPDAVARKVQEGISENFGRILRETSRDLSPVIER